MCMYVYIYNTCIYVYICIYIKALNVPEEPKQKSEGIEQEKMKNANFIIV